MAIVDWKRATICLFSYSHVDIYVYMRLSEVGINCNGMK